MQERAGMAGFIRARFGVYNPGNPDNIIEVEGLVDAGVLYTVISRPILDELGIKPLEKEKV